jgi:hypothetical protein
MVDIMRHHTLKQHGVFELLFAILHKRFIDLTKDFQEVCYLQIDPKDTGSNILNRKCQNPRYK